MKLQLSLLADKIKFLVLTEDEKHEYLLSYLKVHGIIEDEIEIVSYGSCSQFKSTAFKLAEYILKKRKNLKVIMHRDRDYLSENEIEDILKAINKRKYFPLIPNGVDIESIFVNADHINYLYPHISKEVANSMIESCINSAQEDSIDRLTDHYFKNNPPPENKAYAKKIRELRETYEANKNRFFYGKKTFGLLKSTIQTHIKGNPNLLNESPFITNAALIEFANEESKI